MVQGYRWCGWFLQSLGVVFFCAPLVTGCGENNVTGLFFQSSTDEESVDYLLSEAQQSYDAGDFADALESAQKALEISPNQEEAAILLGYIYISLSNTDPIEVARRLIEDAENQGTLTSTGLTQTTGSTSDATESLERLSNLILNLSNEDLAQLGTLNTFSLDSSPQYQVYFPKSLATENNADNPRQTFSDLTFLNQCVQVACPLVGDSVKVAGEQGAGTPNRHSCTALPAEVLSKGKANYLWATCHILEGLRFARLLLYSDTGDQAVDSGAESASSGLDINLTRRATYLTTLSTSTDLTQILNFANGATDLAEAVDAVLDTGPNSMFTGLFNNLSAAASAFGAVGVEDVANTLNSALDSVKESAEQLRTIPGQSGGEGSASEVEGLRSQVNEAIAETVAQEIAQIDPTQFEAGSEEETQFNTACCAFQTIREGTTQAIPEECAGFLDTATDEQCSTLTTSADTSQLPEGVELP